MTDLLLPTDVARQVDGHRADEVYHLEHESHPALDVFVFRDERIRIQNMHAYIDIAPHNIGFFTDRMPDYLDGSGTYIPQETRFSLESGGDQIYDEDVYVICYPFGIAIHDALGRYIHIALDLLPKFMHTMAHCEPINGHRHVSRLLERLTAAGK